MNDIAADAGVTKPVLYQHFESKRDLYSNVLMDVGDRMDRAVFNETTRVGTHYDRTKAGFAGYLEFIENDQDGFSVLLSGATRDDPEFHELARGVEMKMADTAASLIDIEGLDADDRLALAYGIVGMFQGMVRFWIYGQHKGIDRGVLLERMTDLAWHGLRR